MFGLGKPKQVTEREAEGEIGRAYHEIKQSLRVTGVNLNFRTWAGYEKFFPVMWDGMRPTVETRAFEEAADQVRAEAARAAETLGRLDAASQVRLGESQVYQIRAALDLYHYVNPKLLVFTSAVRLALDGEYQARRENGAGTPELIERGVPARMYPMEMVSAEPDDERIDRLFDDIKQTLALSSINSDYRTLALWPDYLEAGWGKLKPVTGRDEYKQSSDNLRETARRLARALPLSTSLTRRQVEELGEDADEIIQTTEKFEQLLPSLVINIALFELDWRTADEALRSQFPAAARGRQ
ncbi:MAG: halocarboxylic acid dehydrogenase DehI family protein [Acidobacteria bacterium]|nr:halocarboxylic acid dehydrogenase DehI family protein [Acidobacteriota bacterium]